MVLTTAVPLIMKSKVKQKLDFVPATRIKIEESSSVKLVVQTKMARAESKFLTQA